MISHKHKCAFVHIPKTGGSTIEEMFRLNGMPDIRPREVHYNAQDMLRAYKHNFEKYYRFSIVRNPWDRVYSVWWNYRDSGKISVDLNYFCRNLQKLKGWSLLFPQTSFLLWNSSVPQMNYVGRFEELPDVFDFIIDKFSLEIEGIPHQKERVGKPKYTDFFNEDSIAVIKLRYESDIEAWGYKYGD